MVVVSKKLKVAIKLNPNLPLAWKIKLDGLRICYTLIHREDIPSVFYAPEVLPQLIEASEWYYKLAPEDEEAKYYFETVRMIARRERELANRLIDKYRKDYPPSP